MRNLRLYKTMFERGSLGQLIVDYASMRVSVVNDAFCSMSGFSADGLVGSAVGAIFPVGQDPSENTVARLAESTTDGYFVERTLQRRDGSTFPVMSSVSAVRDKAGVPVTLFVLFRDLTTQRAAEGTQRRSEALIDAAVAALPVAFSTFDRDLRLTFVAAAPLGREGSTKDIWGGTSPNSATTRTRSRRLNKLSADPRPRRGRSSVEIRTWG
ncbi:MAG: PAS domain-containing protein [Candidatus Dormibacteria bacterium]